MTDVLTPELLLRGYANGIFPMAETRDDDTLFWIDPHLRGILPLDGFYLSRSLRRRMRTGGLGMTINSRFDAVVAACAEREETWINAPLFRLYQALHDAGHAHSLEVWAGDRMIGGVFGVALGGAFFGESMFSRATDGSKVALACLVELLRGAGFELFDTQFTTPHLISLGGREVPRHTYQEMLSSALEKDPDFRKLPRKAQVQDIVQRMTQTS